MSRILPLLQTEGNRRLLRKWLTQSTTYDVVDVDEENPLSTPFDLCVVDGPALGEYRDALKGHREQAAPEFLPVLLLVPREYSDRLTDDVWDYVDDIIWTSGGNQLDSVDTFELEGRLRALLRARSMSETLVENQQRLKVLHRLLRHNIRNSLTVIQGRAEAISTPEENTNVEQILKKSTRLLRHSEKAQDIDEILEKNTEQEIDLGNQVQQIVGRYRDEHPAAEISLDVQASVEVTAIVGIRRAIEELIQNAVRHDPSETPQIRVRVSHENECGVVTVEDSGPTLQEQDRRVLRGDLDPTALNHGSGIGLWLVVWTVRRSNGQITYQTRKTNGNRIVLRLPIAT